MSNFLHYPFGPHSETTKEINGVTVPWCPSCGELFYPFTKPMTAADLARFVKLDEGGKP